MTSQKVLQNYSVKVISGDIIANKFHILAAQRYITDLKRKDVYFDEEFAERCLKLIEGVCRYPKGIHTGKPIVLTVFQKFVILNLLCWRYSNGVRKYKTAYIQLARKSTKTFMMALIALCHLLLDPFPTPYVPVGANDEKQAKILPDMVGKIIEKSPELWKLTNTRGGSHKPFSLYKYKDKYTQVSYKEGNKDGTIEAISSNAATKDGPEPTLAILDEYHEAENDDTREVMKTGQMMVEERMLYTITTAGFNKAGPCYTSLRDMGIKNIEGVIEDDENFVLICEPDEDDDWKDESTWNKSNPMLVDVPIILENLRHDFKDALQKGGSTEVHFKTKNLNTWTNASKVWISDEVWMEAKREYSLDDFSGTIFYGGLDLAKGVDLNAFCNIAMRLEACHKCNGSGSGCIPCKSTGKLSHIYIFPHFWIPESKADDNKDGVDYRKWEQDGLIQITPGNIVDTKYITNYIIEKDQEIELESLGFDRRLSQHGCIQELVDNNIPVQEVIQVAVHLNTVIKELEDLMADRRLHHDGNPIMRWMLSNIEMYTNPEGFYKFDKGKSKNKIDGWAALANAYHEAIKLGWDNNSNTSSWIG